MRAIWTAGQRRRAAAIPAWTLATVLSMVVATVGIQDIASRVSDPLHLNGRAEGAVGSLGALVLSEREGTGRFVEPPLPGAIEPLVARPAEVGPPSPLQTVVGPQEFVPPPPPPAAEVVAGGWTMQTAPSSRTRWVAGEPRPGGAPTHAVEFQSLDGSWQSGYGDNADTTLLSPWYAVPDGEDELRVAIELRHSLEQSWDALTISVRDDASGWVELASLDGGTGFAPPWHFREFVLPSSEAERISLRFHLRSDAGTSSEYDVPLLGRGTAAAVGQVSVVRGALPVPTHLGVPRRPWTRPEPAAQAVIGLTGLGINPYHLEFRDDSARAYAHPSTYLPGYPEHAIALWLSLDAPDLATALAADRKVWAQVTDGTLYWVPGTRIVAMHGFDACGPVEWAGFKDGVCLFDTDVREHEGRVTGIGTSWASRVAGRTAGGCGSCLLAVAQGHYSPDAVRWMAEAPWIDVLSVRGALRQPTAAYNDRPAKLAEVLPGRLVVAQQPQDVDGMVVAEARNGSPDHLPSSGVAPLGVDDTTFVEGVIVVGGQDRGRPVWSAGHVPHLVDDLCLTTIARVDSMDALVDGGLGESTAAMHTAGRVGALLLAARAALGDVGMAPRRPGVLVAPQDSGEPEILLEEFRSLMLRVATPRPPVTGEPRCPDAGWLEGVGYVTLPTPYEEMPADAPVWLDAGYGVLDAAAEQRLAAVLQGEQAPPDRPDEDRWFDAFEELRWAWAEPPSP